MLNLTKKTIYRHLIVPTLALLISLWGAAGTLTAEEGAEVDASDWCGTQRIYEEKQRQRLGAATAFEPCGQDHPCDDPAIRDTWIPDGTQPTQKVRMVIHTIALDDGSNPFSTPEHVAGQVAQLNADFEQVGIEFEYQLNQINSTAWRTLYEDEIAAMKQATAIEPDRYLNVWATIVNFSYSFGTFPWSDDALEATGGIVMGHFHWVDLPNRVFAHEVGHTLGLWHIFHGVDEVDDCTECYEEPGSNSSLIGDLCADTPPTPNNAGPCTDFGGTDPCSGAPWGYTMPENYMGYATQSCLTTFTPEQRGRLRCWSNYVLDNWAYPMQVAASPALGPVPLEVNFTATTHKTAVDWLWDLEDGSTASGPTTVYTYSTPGLKNINLDLQTDRKNYSVTYPGLVAAYADTVKITDGRFDGAKAQVDIYVRNYLPLKTIEIPFSYQGEFSVRFDSISAIGHRTEAIGVGLVSLVEANKLASVLIGGSGTELPAGQGTVGSLHFTLLQGVTDGTIAIAPTDYPRHELQFDADVGSYRPVAESGSIRVNCCEGTVGDANADGQPLATIGDVQLLVSHKFISGIPLDCYLEADINQSGGINPSSDDITIGDIVALIDHLFINRPALPDCL